jgi:Protein of unknown function (DUF2971)
MALDEAIVQQLEDDLRKVRYDGDRQEVPLFHYTNASGLLGILEKRQIWATHVSHLNDREELVVGERIALEEIERLASEEQSAPVQTLHREHASIFERAKLSANVDIYVASLTEDGDLLSQWRAYGANGAGYALGFQGLRLPSDADDSPDAELILILLRCEYDLATFRAKVRAVLLEVAETFKRYLDQHGCDAEHVEAFRRVTLPVAVYRVQAMVPRLKDPAFREEREWRLVALCEMEHEKELLRFRAGPHGLQRYLPVDLADSEQAMNLAQVYVGPTQDQSVGVSAARALLRWHGYDPALVVSSTVPYRG